MLKFSFARLCVQYIGSATGSYWVVWFWSTSSYFVQIVYIVQAAHAAWTLTKDRELVKKRAIEKEGFIVTCNKINTSLLSIFQRFKDRDNFGLWILNKNGRIGIGKATTILYSKDIGTGSEVEKSLQQTYNTDELE